MIKPEDIEVGDIVRLSCGSVKMTVESIYPGEQPESYVADVLYYVDGVGIERDTVSLAHLVWPKNQESDA